MIEHVSDTAFWVARHRANESARPDALFQDPLAARLAGEHGEKLARSMPNAEMTGWAVVMRTVIIDELIAGAIAQGVDTVVNLGAGLDTRPYRMTLPASLHWIEVDHPHLIDFKEAQLADEAPRCRLERVRLDLSDLPARRALFARIQAEASQVLVLTEGVVPYLAEAEVAALADDLRALDRFRFWVTDYFSAQVLAYRRRSGVQAHMAQAPFRFEPADWLGFFAERSWKLLALRDFHAEGTARGRPIPLPRRIRVLLALTRWLPGSRKRQKAGGTGYLLLTPDSGGPDRQPGAAPASS